jgi:hypothetical protein
MIDHAQFKVRFKLTGSRSTDAGADPGVGDGHPFGMQIQAGTGTGSGQEASGRNRSATAGSFG